MEGKIDFSNNNVVLYEIANEKHTAIFEFKLLKGMGDGSWLNKSTSKKLPLYLEMVSKIVDLNLNSEFSDVDVLQFQSLKDFYLVSSYSKVKGVDKAQLAKLKIIRKKTIRYTRPLIFQV